MTDPLDCLWPLMESPAGTVRAHGVARWPDGVRDRLREFGFVVTAGDSSRVLCPECRTHSEEVFACESARGTRLFISCPDHIRVQVAHEDRALWRVDHGSVVPALASTLRVTGKVSELSRQRCWRLGRTNLNGEHRDVLFARGLTWNDADTIRGAITSARKPIVFVPMDKPTERYWTGRVPPVIALDQVAVLTEAGIEIDPLEITAAIQDAETMTAHESVHVSADQFALMIRRQIKAEHRTELTDAVYLAAYRQHGSVRKAAEYLSQQTGAEVTKDKVHQAVKRAGGAAEVLNAESSESVVRPVASQSRDKKGKPLICSQTPAEE